MLQDQATKDPTASGIFLDSWNGQLLDAGINGTLPLVERVLLDLILPSSSMGSVLSSTAAPQPLCSPSPWHWLAGLDF